MYARNKLLKKVPTLFYGLLSSTILRLTALQKHLSEHYLKKDFHPAKVQKLIRTEGIRRQAYTWNDKEKPLVGLDALLTNDYAAGGRSCRERDENDD